MNYATLILECTNFVLVVGRDTAGVGDTVPNAVSRTGWSTGSGKFHPVRRAFKPLVGISPFQRVLLSQGL